LLWTVKVVVVCLLICCGVRSREYWLCCE
jgi:hypothetical protein